ncbi:vignain-like [Hibiscus syriacus]|uniref:Vignain-like n=1 Tax=Hibiscus syriacus TaxID=106335 RepID=A0A6A2ZGH2_HIBSY|nr:vignain-like [Hibiscus syriacus]
MGSKWRKAKLAIGMNMCLYVPHQKLEDSTPSSSSASIAKAASLSPVSPSENERRPTTPTPSSSGLRLSKSSPKSSKRTCSICLKAIKPSQGHATFTAECSHSFHFHCITSNVKHGNQICPICRAKWKDIPCQSPTSDLPNGRSRINPGDWPRDDAWITAIRQMHSLRLDPTRQIAPLFHHSEPETFDDDEVLNQQLETTEENVFASDATKNNSSGTIEVKTYPEVSAIPRATSPFSSTARRLFPLRRMTETGRQEALQAVNSLTSNGGTNIAEGLRKAAKVIVDQKWKNPVGSIILLSDGQDTYTVVSPGGAHSRTDYKLLLPAGPRIPVHAFGFGADHDAASMHSISEISGGTFSFIEAEGVIQDAFAQCIGGLLSVVVQEACVKVECTYPDVVINSIKAGSYRTSVSADAKTGSIDAGDLYAEEERDFLVTVHIPVDESIDEMSLLKRPTITGQTVVSMEVDRERNRLRAAEAMAEARAAAEHGDLTTAVSLLESCRRALSETDSARAGDRLCVVLSAELKEMQERMVNRRVYESSGRAYVLSGLSSHSWQRATARGDSTDSTSLVQAYQTPTMTDMVTRSQTMFFGNPPRRKLRQAQSFPARPEPR